LVAAAIARRREKSRTRTAMRIKRNQVLASRERGEGRRSRAEAPRICAEAGGVKRLPNVGDGD
jgi:hypothetical protein